MTAIIDPVFLGVENHREYYQMPDGRIAWKVPSIREAIRAENGYKIISADFSQIEIRIMASMSKDPWLINALTQAGTDIHCYLAADVFGKEMNFDYALIYKAYKDHTHPRHKELTELRSKIKAVSFGLPYGAGPKSIGIQTKQSTEDAAKLIDRYFGKATVLKQWLERQGMLALKDGFSSSKLGRRRFYEVPTRHMKDFEEIIAQIKRWAGNQPIQAGCADMLKLALATIYHELRVHPEWQSRLLFVVHDEIVMTCLEKYADLNAQLLKTSMDGAYYQIIQDVPHETDVAVADRWMKA